MHYSYDYTQQLINQLIKMSPNNAHPRFPFVEQPLRMNSPTQVTEYLQAVGTALEQDIDSGNSVEEDISCSEDQDEVCGNENEDFEIRGNPDYKSTSTLDHAGSVPLHLIMLKAPPEVKARLLKEQDAVRQQHGLLKHLKHKPKDLISLQTTPVSSRTRARAKMK